MAGLYIHIPYCHSKCSYCDFFSTPRSETIDMYIDALLIELDIRSNEIIDNFTTIYIGGGTPSILTPKQLSRLVNGISQYINLSDIREFTIEANPEDITDDWCRVVLSLGINRVSMGIQSFNNNELKIINRRHSAQDAIKAIETLRRNNIIKISCDLIYGLPTQTLNSWGYSLDKLLKMDLPHFSAYLLSYEPGTRLYMQLKNGKVEEASDELALAMYQLLITKAASMGYEHYEISNFSKPNHNAIHNSNYWKNSPYLGLGVSAHSFDGNKRRYNANKIKEYIVAMSNHSQFATIEEETIEEQHNDYIIVSLRTSKGINLDDYLNKWGEEKYNQLLSTAQNFILCNQMSITNNYLAILEKHMLISDSIMVEFII